MISANGEEGAEQHHRERPPDLGRHHLASVVPFERGHRHQPKVLNQQGNRDVDPGDGQVIAELHPRQADAAEDGQRGKLTTAHPEQHRPEQEQGAKEPGEGEPDPELGQQQRRVAQPEQRLDGVAAGGEQECREHDEPVTRPN